MMDTPRIRPARAVTQPGRVYPPTSAISIADRLHYSLARHWVLLASLGWGLFVGLPWLAPVMMQAGWTGIGKVIYSAYSFTCHQLPERSYFLFGPKAMYSLEEIQAVWQDTNNPLILRQFIGNQAMGWKVAWSDRMVSLYTSMLAGLALLAVVGRRLPQLQLWALALWLIPMALDGGTHAVSELLGGGVGLGFRDSNTWLAALSGNVFPAAFYAGDEIGSFNWIMRLITGALMGLAVVWFLFPQLAGWAEDARGRIGQEVTVAGETP